MPRLEDLPLPDGDFGWPIIGNTLALLRDPRADSLERMKKYGKIYKNNVFGRKTAVIFGTENVQEVMVGDASQNVESNWVGSPGKLFGALSILNQNGADHTRMRRLVGPFFTRKAAASYLPFVVETANDFCERFAAQGSFSLLPEMRRYAFFVNTIAVIGMKISEELAEEMLEQLQFFVGAFFSLEINLPFTTFGKGMRARAALLKMIKEAIDLMKSTPEDAEQAAKVFRKVVDARDENGDRLAEDEIGDLILTLLFAGFDTTAQTMTALIFELAQHPEVWDKLRAEQQQIVEKFGEEITAEALDAMSYTDAVVKETMRLRVIAEFVIRRAVKSFELGGYRIPEGWALHVQTGGTMRLLDERWKSDADQFKPERFLEEGAAKGAYMPWGLGPHLCLGKAIAESEMRAMLALLARKYRVIVEKPDVEYTGISQLVPLDGVPVRVEKLN